MQCNSLIILHSFHCPNYFGQPVHLSSVHSRSEQGRNNWQLILSSDYYISGCESQHNGWMMLHMRMYILFSPRLVLSLGVVYILVCLEVFFSLGSSEFAVTSGSMYLDKPSLTLTSLLTLSSWLSHSEKWIFSLNLMVILLFLWQ